MVLGAKKRRVLMRGDRIGQLERRIEYLETALYQLFQLTERLLETVEKCEVDNDVTPRTPTPSERKILTTVRRRS